MCSVTDFLPEDWDYGPMHYAQGMRRLWHMSNATLFRLNGLTLVLGGVLGGVASAVHPPDLTDPINVPVHLALYVAIMLIALGLPGLYLRHSEATKVAGLIGMVMLFFGIVFGDTIHSVIEFTVMPVITANPDTAALMHGGPPGLMAPLMIAFPVLLLGQLIFAITWLRAAELPRWPAVVACASVVLVIAGFPFNGTPLRDAGPALLYFSMAIYGWELLAQRQSTAATRLTQAVATR